MLIHLYNIRQLGLLSFISNFFLQMVINSFVLKDEPSLMSLQALK